MFTDRYDAGEQLALRLTKYRGRDTVVYALPRGGVLVGYEIAQKLKIPLDLVITRKIGHPADREFAICAITEDGERVCDESSLQGIDEEWLENASNTEKSEAERRRQIYKGGAASISAKGKLAIVVDDGIATGLTIRAAIKAIKKQQPKKLIVAIPVAPHEVVERLRTEVDAVVVVSEAINFLGAVGQYYANFPEVFDKEVQVCLRQAEQKYKEEANGNYKNH